MKKIVHVCLCGPMTDAWNYQENLLTKYHKKNGYDVTVITSRYAYNDKGERIQHDSSEYYYNGIKMIRVENSIGDIDSRFKLYKDVYQILEKEKPDILFVHGVQFLDLRIILKYVKKYKTKLVIDNHADSSNSGTNWLSINILHKVIWRYMARRIEPYTTKFYGVLPARVDFLTNVYGIPTTKCELLLMGADDELVELSSTKESIDKERIKYKVQDNDFLIVTGGKIDKFKKQTLLLMQAIKKLPNLNVKLIVFGSVEHEIEPEFSELLDQERIIYAGWLNSIESYKLFAASELVVFPGRHSVFWEQVAGQGIPMVCKYWKGTQHVDVGGNVTFIENDSVERISEIIGNIINNPEVYRNMKRVATEVAAEQFLYSDIAKKCIE